MRRVSHSLSHRSQFSIDRAEEVVGGGKQNVHLSGKRQRHGVTEGWWNEPQGFSFVPAGCAYRIEACILNLHGDCASHPYDGAPGIMILLTTKIGKSNAR